MRGQRRGTWRFKTRNQKPETRNRPSRKPFSGFWFLVSGLFSRFLECLVHQHHRDVAHDRVDAVALDALQPLLDDRLLAAELLAELVAQGGAPPGRQRHRPHLFLAERARQDFEQLGVDGHRRRSVAFAAQCASSISPPETAGPAPPRRPSPRPRRCARRASMPTTRTSAATSSSRSWPASTSPTPPSPRRRTPSR